MSDGTGPIRVLLVDDHAFYREGIKAMLTVVGADIDVVGEAATGEDAVEQAVAIDPEVVVMDLAMPGMSGLEATRRILSGKPNVAILVLTMADDDSVFAAIRAGARGYLLKDASIDELVAAVIAVRGGQAIFSPSTGDRVLSALADGDPGQTGPEFSELTKRELDVLRLLAAGCSNHEIGVQLQLTPKTVRNYVSNILTKLGVRDRTQAVIRARDAGLT